jgi:hypothetical protein
MPKKYNKERIHKLFLETKGDIRLVMGHKGTPRTRRTIDHYAKEEGWYDELSAHCIQDDDIERLEKVRSVIYQFLIQEPSHSAENLELKPKTYTEAVKCYLDIDTRIDEKKGKSSNIESNSWEDIIKRCMSSDE